MRTAIISDIHSNIEALTAVMEDMESLDIDEIVCLGDIVGYGPNPNECIRIAQQKFNVVLLGNHDAAALDTEATRNFNINAKIAIEWTTNQLTKESKSFLKELPMSRTLGDCTYVHATPYEPRMWYYISSVEEAGFNFQFFNTRFCFIGHTHIPVIITQDRENHIDVFQNGKIEFSFDDDRSFLINVGSVGQPRDRNSNACYGLLDTEAGNFVLRRVEYDIDKCQKKMRKNKLPDFLVNRLAEGK